MTNKDNETESDRCHIVMMARRTTTEAQSVQTAVAVIGKPVQRARCVDRLILCVVLSLFARMCPAGGLTDLDSEIAFDIPAQSLSSAILRYSEQSGIQVTSPSELLSGRRTRGLNGTQTARTALQRLLEGTGLLFEAVNLSTVAIRPVPPTHGYAKAAEAQASASLTEAHAGQGAINGRPPADSGGTVASTRNPSSLDEVVISSRKQSETLLDVPQSVTAFSAHVLQEYNVQSFADYATMTPNLSFSYGTGQLGFATSRSVAIRGITGAGTTSLYIDDTPVPESIDPRLVDIERIEVLKGPQGTLYGESSLGGNVRVITVQPSFGDSDGHVSVHAAATSHGASPDYGGDFAGTLIAIPDRVAIRAVAFVNHDAGFLTRTFLTDGGADASSHDNQGATLTYGGSLSVLTSIDDNLSITLRTMYQQQSADGWPATWARLPQFVPASLTVNRAADVQEIAADNWYLPSLQLDYLGRGWSLTSSTSYLTRKAHDIEDGTEGTADILSAVYGLRLNPLSPIPWDGYYEDHRLIHETRISLKKTNGLSAVVGVYFSKTIDKGILDSHGIPGIASAGLWPTDLAWYSKNENETRSNAVFGELYYDISRFQLALGLRRYALRENGAVYAAGALNGQLTNQILEQTSQQGASPKFALSYKFNPDTMIYGLVAKGFRAGGAGGPLPPICEPFPSGLNLQPNQATSYGSDAAWNYEIGAKATAFDGRILVTGAAFQMNWIDIQQAVTLPRCFITFTTNAGAARTRGGEFEVSGHPWQAVELRAGLGFDDAVITDEGFSRQPVGSRVYQIPRWTWMVGGTYTRSMSAGMSSFVTLDLSHVGDSVSGTSGIGTGLLRPAYTILNGRLGVRWSHGELALYATNLANERANLGNLNPISYAPTDTNGDRTLRIALLRPLQIGVQLRHTL